MVDLFLQEKKGSVNLILEKLPTSKKIINNEKRQILIFSSNKAMQIAEVGAFTASVSDP